MAHVALPRDNQLHFLDRFLLVDLRLVLDGLGAKAEAQRRQSLLLVQRRRRAADYQRRARIASERLLQYRAASPRSLRTNAAAPSKPCRQWLPRAHRAAQH